jgi:glycosyltransferase involved in cell wall biosynthesis
LHLLVNALSIGSMSGQHVVYGFLRPISRWALPAHQITVLHYENERPPAELLERGVKTIEVPQRWKAWYKRIWWETTKLAQLLREHGCDVMLNVSGALAPRCPVPQVVLCQNPWCYVPMAHRDAKDRFKARLQRIGYARAFRDSSLIVYISHHLQDLYRRGNPGVREAASAVAYVGIDNDTFEVARQLAGEPRHPLTILSVSAMAHWKGAHTLVDAVKLLHDRQVPAVLKLVGPWPDNDYEERIRQQVRALGLESSVLFLGRVSDEELHHLYATSRVFCLMSGCESYGIPAAEAMTFGTPVVSTDCCAIAEICEGAGQFGPLNDPAWTADALQLALTDDQKWQAWSKHARENANCLTWSQCAKPFEKLESLTTSHERK